MESLEREEGRREEEEKKARLKRVAAAGCEPPIFRVSMRFYGR